MRQVENARAYALAKGWTVEDAHIHTDDAVSGADTKRLRNRQRMIDAATARAFEVVVMQAQDR
jgi:resolvase-like protein